MDRRLPALFALAVALLLLANPLYLYPHAGQPEYSHSIERIDASEIPDEAAVLNYTDLSPNAKRAVDKALASPDNDAVVYGEANKPPEFFYSDYAEVGQGIYFIYKDGTYYQLTTYAGGGLFPIDLWLRWGMFLFGACLATLGVRSLRDERRRVPAAFGGLGALFVAVAGAGVEPYGGLGLFAAILLGSVAALVTVGYLLRSRTAAAVAGVFALALLVGPPQGIGPRALTPAFGLAVAALVGVGMALRQIRPVRRIRERMA